MDFTKRKFKFIFCECFALVTIKSKVLTQVLSYHNVKKTPAFFIMWFTIFILSCFLAHSCVKEHAQCIPVGVDFGKTATTSNMDGTEYAVYAAPFGCRVWITTFFQFHCILLREAEPKGGVVQFITNYFWNIQTYFEVEARLVWYNVKIPKK